ncbi:MAG TPA: NADH-quinone oxidoreductase subunit NuoE [Desulfobacteraceae bacterium]|mgnify:CR=1 FL=1|jgi:NADH-quinone oxidoreductase subunit E|nr:NADH-quinone oxidoreductase subunit NuoE [Desulfobacteraceae bacterium]
MAPSENVLLDEDELFARVEDALKHETRDRANLIPLLQTVQRLCSYIPESAVRLLAGHFDISPCEVYGVATFYNQFRFNPPGRHQIKVCMGTACHVRGGDIILENFSRKLGIDEGETTEDREFSLERVACVGCCALAPVAVIGETVHGKMAPSKVEGLILGFQIEKDRAERGKTQDDRTK